MSLSKFFLILCVVMAFGIHTTQYYALGSREFVNMVELLPDGFGLEQGSLINLNLTFDNSTPFENVKIVFMILKDDTLSFIRQSKWQNEIQNTHVLCGLASTYQKAIMSTVNEIKFRTPETDRYNLILMKCAKNDLTIRLNLELTAMGAQNQHLSLQDIPLIQIYVSLMVVYFIAFFAFTGIVVQNYEFVHKLHILLIMGTFTKFFEMLVDWIFFVLLNREGSTHFMTVFLKDLVGVASETMFLICMSLASIGWGVFAASTNRREKRVIWGMFILFFGFKMLFAMCSQPAICPAYILCFKLIKFVIMFGIIVALNQNIENLRSQLTDENHRNQSYLLLDMFKLYRWAFLGYLILPIPFIFYQVSFMSWQDEWLIILSQQALDLMVYSSLLIGFRPRRIHLR